MDIEDQKSEDIGDRIDSHSARLSSAILDAAHHSCRLNMPHDVFFYMKTFYDINAKLRTVKRRLSAF